MNKFKILIFVGLLTNCSVDRKDYINVSKTLTEAVIDNDTTEIKNLFIHNMDSISVQRKSAIFSRSQELKDKKYTFIKADTASMTSFFDNKSRVRMMYAYVKIDTSYYSFSANYSINSNQEIELETLNINSLTNECNNWETTIYCPTYYIEFKRLIWNTDYYNKSFKSGTVELQNNLSTDIDYIKFRVILKHDWNTFFNQTVTSHNQIYSGDIAAIEVPGMKDLFAGFDIKRESVQFSAELIEVGPKPESQICKKINQLKTIK